MNYLSPDDDFSALSLPDLLAARDQFHLHLLHKPNVIGTAIGRYRIRKSDPWPDHRGEKRVAHKTARTLANSQVRGYSWPAILVFVNEWIEAGDFTHPQDAIPPAVYLPDGHRVPICVILADRDDVRPEQVGNFNFPASFIGGGYPVICDVQGQEHVASIGCLVTDGHRTYAMTNRHVAGEPGSTIYSLIGGNKVAIGKSAHLQLTRKPFTDLYPEWPGKDVYVDLDVGLIDIDDLSRWTTQVYGIGEIGELADFDSSNLSLELIGCPVRAYGAASRAMSGEICALFYRFKSVGGFEYVSDLLIGPREDAGIGTHPGDSGTLWMIDDPQGSTQPRPVALQWGGQVFLGSGGGGSSYALATLLSTVCNRLNVSLVRAWNTGLPEYWGAVGHYSIATKAIAVIRNRNLGRLMQNNLERISFEMSSITKKNMKGLSKRDFVPLADVPDMVWKVGPYKRGGMTSPEHANHFADMDRQLKNPLPEGATLLEICRNKPQNVNVVLWGRYYDAVSKQFPKEHESRGLLPFRVWQIYQEMVQFAAAGDVAGFVCAAGILSHYVGDSCQPLHISYLFNGNPDKLVDGAPEGEGVHSAYEDDMVDAHVALISTGVDSLATSGAAWPLITGGHGAAVSVVNLMQKTFAAIPPMEIIESFLPIEKEKPAQRAQDLWNSNKLGERTIEAMADGCLCLAQLWDSAWKEGDGDTKISRLEAIDETTLEKLYRNPDFLHSYSLDTIGPILNGASGSVAAGSSATARKKKAAKKK